MKDLGSVDPRAALETLVRERRDEYAGLSRLLGRNPSYIQQYVIRGTPRRLAEEDRRTLARYFDVDETLLGGPTPPAERRVISAAAGGAALRGAELVAVPRFAVGASAGPGALDIGERVAAAMPLPMSLLRELGVGDPAALSIIQVAGDSMRPTLADGDDILVDGSDAGNRMRDGIYVLRAEEALLVKRLALKPGGGLAVLSDNPEHPDWLDVDRAAIEIIGRVLWAGRKLR